MTDLLYTRRGPCCSLRGLRETTPRHGLSERQGTAPESGNSMRGVGAGRRARSPRHPDPPDAEARLVPPLDASRETCEVLRGLAGYAVQIYRRTGKGLK